MQIAQDGGVTPVVMTPFDRRLGEINVKRLKAGIATLSAERYLMRVLRRGPDKTYFVPAHRALVDLALETRQVARVRDRR